MDRRDEVVDEIRDFKAASRREESEVGEREASRWREWDTARL